MNKLIVYFFIILFLLRLQFLPSLDLKENQLVSVTGVLDNEPQISGNQQKLSLGHFDIWTQKYPEYHYKDKLKITGRVKRQSKASLFPFPVPSYSLANTEIILVNQSQTKGLRKLAINLKNKLLVFYRQAFFSPLDGIVAGIVLGDRSLIDQETWEKMRATGTLHIMVASGMNVSFIAVGSLSFLTIFLKRKKAILIMMLMIYLYTIMTGLMPSIIRAATMVILIYLGHLTGREASGGRILLLTGLLMVFVSPYLIFDIGFQLSFLATAGLVYLQPRLQAVNNFLFRNANFSSTLAAQFFTLPILLSNFGYLNIASPFINLLILWAIPFVLQAGIVFAVGYLIIGKIAIIPSYLLFPLLAYINQIINLAANLKLFEISVPKIGIILSFLYYLILGLLIFKKQKKNYPNV